MTNEQHNRYIAYAFFANAGFYLLITIFMLALFGTFMSFPGEPGSPPEFFAIMMTFMAVFYGVFMIPSIIAGYGLLKRRSWARVASIAAAVVAGMNFPIGTGACVYALWFFFSENWKEIYPDEAFGRVPRQIAYGVETQRAAYEEAAREKRFDQYHPPDWR